MNWFITLFSSTLGKKLIMALTGLFLISFLVIHLIGNLQLLHHDEGRAFNTYAEFMGTNTLVQIISKVNFALIIMHAVWGLILTIRNRKARGPQGYVVVKNSSPWTSRNMGILGTLILIFLVVHIKHFYAEAHFGGMSTLTYDGEAVRNLYGTVVFWFSKGWYVSLYVVCMAALGFHLWHGFASAFQSLGLNHPKYNPLILFVGRAFAVIVPALFALIPIVMFSTNQNPG
jgi:succinate dehydrogenase / fumarate reductase cytochrome b subunit